MNNQSNLNQPLSQPRSSSSLIIGKIVVTFIILAIIVTALVIAGLWFKQTKKSPSGELSNAPGAIKLLPLPEAYYDITATVKDINTTSFTVTTRLRTEKNTLAEGYQDVTLTVNYDQATKFLKRGPYTGNGQIPPLVSSTPSELKPGLSVDIRSRENLRGIKDSFMAAEVIIKTNVSTKK